MLVLNWFPCILSCELGVRNKFKYQRVNTLAMNTDVRSYGERGRKYLERHYTASESYKGIMKAIAGDM